jgi:peroxiredoxin
MMGHPSRRLALYLGAGVLLGLAIGAAAFFGFPSPAEVAPPPAASRGSQAPQAAAQLAAAPVVGAPAPDFELIDLDGATVRLADLRGRPILLNFWATWCDPCRDEMPLFESALGEFGDAGLVVLGIDADEPAELVAEFRDELELTFPLLLDPGGEVQELYRIRGYPTTFFVDAEGVIRAQHIGVLREERLRRYLVDVGIGES